eukprot:13081726-Alexandrium_andersonii.AAC.1
MLLGPFPSHMTASSAYSARSMPNTICIYAIGSRLFRGTMRQQRPELIAVGDPSAADRIFGYGAL